MAIVGAGPAGLAAAGEAVDHGLSIMLMDDNSQPGGQYFRQLSGVERVRHGRAGRLFGVLDHPSLHYRPDCVVWNAPEKGVLAYASEAGSGRVRADTIIIATGATDRPLPFPGWTLPGVITAGGSQNMIKGQAVRPGDRVVVAGNGPLLLVAAMTLMGAGATVVAVIEAAPLQKRAWSRLASLSQSPSGLVKALSWRLRLATAGVPILAGQAVIEAHGEAALEAVSIAPVDRHGAIDRGRVATLEADCVVVGNGLTPAVELTRLAGCAHHHDPLLGGWTPRRSADLETSIPGLYAAGDGAAIGGVELALAEGRAAVLAAMLQHSPSAHLRRRRNHLARRLKRLERFRAAVADIFAPPEAFLELITPGTPVCRCENVTLAELEAGATGMIRQKSATRLSMGRCQGRFCLATLADLVAKRQGIAVADLDWPRVRPPARPVRLGTLLHESVPPPALPDDPHLPRGS